MAGESDVSWNDSLRRGVKLSYDDLPLSMMYSVSTAALECSN